jgi:ribonuclease-3
MIEATLCDELTGVLGVEVPRELLELALTHPSAVGEGIERTLLSNQRLEFLGDAVLGAVAAAHLYASEPRLPEGDLTQRKAAAVQKRSLAQAARRLELGRYVRLSAGAQAAGGRERDGILSDTLEALIGAIFLSHGFEAARAFVQRVLSAELEEAEQRAGNVKNALQEKSQAVGLGTPVYRAAVIGGPAHSRQFSAEVLIADQVRGRGRGASKKEAEQRAATEALKALHDSE